MSKRKGDPVREQAKSILRERLIALGEKSVADMSEEERWLASCGICQSAELDRIARTLRKAGHLKSGERK